MPSKAQRIVVVEDDASMSQAIARILRAGGFLPILFASAEAALEAGVAPAADCLVLDIQLPGMSGFDLYSLLARAGEEPPAIFITANDEPAVRARAEKAGASSYHPKPFAGRTLLDAVNQAIRSPDVQSKTTH
jgi:FixJ family two-component response regulator